MYSSGVTAAVRSLSFNSETVQFLTAGPDHSSLPGLSFPLPLKALQSTRRAALCQDITAPVQTPYLSLCVCACPRQYAQPERRELDVLFQATRYRGLGHADHWDRVA